jgi:aspartate 1-decarboxylase
MTLEVLKSKLHQACITDANIHYEGSIGIDRELMELVGFHEYEKVLVANINNGERLETYVIAAPFGSRKIILNGAAARRGVPGDRIIIMSFARVEEGQLKQGVYKPRVARLSPTNDPIDARKATPSHAEIASMIGG